MTRFCQLTVSWSILTTAQDFAFWSLQSLTISPDHKSCGPFLRFLTISLWWFPLWAARCLAKIDSALFHQSAWFLSHASPCSFCAICPLFLRKLLGSMLIGTLPCRDGLKDCQTVVLNLQPWSCIHPNHASTVIFSRLFLQSTKCKKSSLFYSNWAQRLFLSTVKSTVQTSIHKSSTTPSSRATPATCASSQNWGRRLLTG